MTVRVAIRQLRPEKARPDATLARVSEVFREVADLRPVPRVLLFPEAALTGYFMEGGVREHALGRRALFEELRRRWAEEGDADRPLEVAIGFFERHRERVYNSALYAVLGGSDPRILHVHRKVFLPTYGVFQEERFVEAGSSFGAFDTPWGRAGLLICEDAFHSLPPTLAALDGARVVFILSASPARGAHPGPGVPGNLERWDRLARGIAEEHGVFVAVAQLVGFEGGKGFAGGSAVYDPRGRAIVRGGLWREELLVADLDLAELLPVRVESPLLADLEAALPRILQNAGLGGLTDGSGGDPESGPTEASEDGGGDDASGDAPAGAGEAAHDEPTSARAAAGGGDGTSGRRTAALRTAAAAPDPGDFGPLEIDTALVEPWLLEFLRQEVRHRRGFERVVVGLSGGVDSSLTATLCARALGPEAVKAYLMPSDVTSAESIEDAELVAETLGIETRTIPITDAVQAYLGEHEPDAEDQRRGNVMARQRMIVLFDQAARHDGLPVGTGNKSERLLGYFTWHADDSPPINPLGDLFKTQVWALARAVDVPESIVEKPATAELVVGQTDEEDLGVSYPEADLILHHLLRGSSPERLVSCGFDERKVRTVHRRLESTHYKRHLPTVAMLSDTTIGEWYLRPVDY
ncbi:MAG TPA: NAD+ synthase [Gemmatimonadota bacterium]|nr:NAD+ synthase [Gemmatimonadota bacterium]